MKIIAPNSTETVINKEKGGTDVIVLDSDDEDVPLCKLQKNPP